jgi:hypothetical protein
MADTPRQTSELERLETIKIHAIIAMFSDDELMEKLVLKGGNALDLIYRISPRAPGKVRGLAGQGIPVPGLSGF